MVKFWICFSTSDFDNIIKSTFEDSINCKNEIYLKNEVYEVNTYPFKGHQ